MKISIITPVLNGEESIRRCVESVGTQQYDFFEHIVVCGPSTDSTYECLLKLKKEYPNLLIEREISNGENVYGPGRAWNQGLKIASGDYFGWLGFDDSMPHNLVLKEVANSLMNNNNPDVLCGAALVVDESLNPITTITPGVHSAKKLKSFKNEFPWTSLYFSKKALSFLGCIDDYGNDFLCLLKLTSNFEVKLSTKVWSLFMKRREAESTNVKKLARVLEQDYYYSVKYGGNKIFNTYLCRYVFYRMLGFLCAQVLYQKVRFYFKRY